MVLLQIENIDLNKAWEISPYNGAAYGGIVVILIFAIWYLVKQLEKADEALVEERKVTATLFDKVHTISEELGNKLVEAKHGSEMNTTKVVSLIELVLERLKKLDKLN